MQRESNLRRGSEVQSESTGNNTVANQTSVSAKRKRQDLTSSDEAGSREKRPAKRVSFEKQTVTQPPADNRKRPAQPAMGTEARNREYKPRAAKIKAIARLFDNSDKTQHEFNFTTTENHREGRNREQPRRERSRSREEGQGSSEKSRSAATTQNS